MDMDLLELRCRQSDFFKAELIASNSMNPKYVKVLSEILNFIQMEPSLSKKFLKGYKNTREYIVMQNKVVFEAFIEIELNIKKMYLKEAEKEKEITSMKSLLE